MIKRNLTLIASVLGMTIIILDGKGTLGSASEGISVCIKSLIPSLFPFFVLSPMLTSTLSGMRLSQLKPLETFCRIPKGSGVLVLLGSLSGYPVGAQNIFQAHKEGLLSREDAQRMLAFCNNAGPAFLFGILGSMFSDGKIPWLLWVVQILSALLVARSIPGDCGNFVKISPKDPVNLSQAMEQALRAMARVCGWVILFRILLGFLDRWFLWLLPGELSVLVAGFLELANGCLRLRFIDSVFKRFVLSSVLLSFGGFCVGMQTRSVCPGLSLRLYYLGKLLQTVYSFLLSVLLYRLYTNWTLSSIWLIAAAIVLSAGVFFTRLKKNSSSKTGDLGV